MNQLPNEAGIPGAGIYVDAADERLLAAQHRHRWLRRRLAAQVGRTQAEAATRVWAVPADHIPVYAKHLHAFGRHDLTDRRTLLRITWDGAGNTDLTLEARNALRGETPFPPASCRVTVAAARNTAANAMHP